MNEKDAEKEFYDWVANVFRINRQKIENNALRFDSAQRIISAAQEGRVKYEENAVVYTLAYPVGDIREVRFNARIKAKTVMELQTVSGVAQTYKFFECTMTLPAAIVGELDLYDFTTLAGFFSFL